jgi:hypothetical protein
MEEGLNLGSAELSPAPTYRTIPYNADKARENVRGLIALWLIVLLASTIALSFFLVWRHPDRDKELHELLGLIFSPLIALVGTATGYYFGSQSSSRQEKGT